eukprot:12000995-Prorocentrum_lima.AAC.1
MFVACYGTPPTYVHVTTLVWLASGMSMRPRMLWHPPLGGSGSGRGSGSSSGRCSSSSSSSSSSSGSGSGSGSA